MATLIEISNVTKSYGAQELLKEASIALADEQKIGFIGRNGAGKSTLLRILLEDETVDSGQIIRHPNLRVGYLRQHDPFKPGESALDFLMRDSGQPDWRCGAVAGQFELKGRFLNGPVKELSGGWQTRVKLAALLLHEPNFLMLDEPTNFLDLRTQLLLEDFLKDYRGACLVVSHDRSFLKAICTQTLELKRGKLTLFNGNVDQYLENQEILKERDERTNATVLAKRRQLETFIAKNKAGANTASQARSKEKQLARLTLTEIEGAESTVNIIIPQTENRQGIALACEDLAIGYPDLRVAENITLEIEHGARAAIVGDNGQGKTTFLRTITDSLPPLDGNLKWGYHCNVACYAQHVYTSLPDSQTIRDYLELESAPGTTTQQILAVAGSFLFKEQALDKPIKVLSGGERARLCLAGILLGKHSILILDEPGNHLDVETVEALGNALVDFQGTVIFTSHDRHFMSKVATDVIEVANGSVKSYEGDYDAYLYRVKKEVADGHREQNQASVAQQEQKTSGPREKGLGGKIKNARKELSAIERKIAQLDEKRNEINDKFLKATNPETAEELHTEMQPLVDEIGELEIRWMELYEFLEQ
ncbi:ABC-F family ATP-binding cassette domain-containing protein [Gimesia fumaroli]|uniref:Putative ABC transporter ATP-binding protein YheS n=1 Tax=Gimesia fumaroli TaxID=2527976 RepID=A0A518IDP6_9PLAN|nr:ABC-F family ATP-binding cassette domain-containing protein [Gimesia fumaroli]QDV51232.1 putative ABC transporter ATP-binding protein YheS [Gimesia fumaroli]